VVARPSVSGLLARSMSHNLIELANRPERFIRSEFPKYWGLSGIACLTIRSSCFESGSNCPCQSEPTSISRRQGWRPLAASPAAKRGRRDEVNLESPSGASQSQEEYSGTSASALPSKPPAGQCFDIPAPVSGLISPYENCLGRGDGGGDYRDPRAADRIRGLQDSKNCSATGIALTWWVAVAASGPVETQSTSASGWKRRRLQKIA
jgi:hypothetical protein